MPLLAGVCLAYANSLLGTPELIGDGAGWAVLINAAGVLVVAVVAFPSYSNDLTVALLVRLPSFLVCLLAVVATVASLSGVPALVHGARLADRGVLHLDAAAQASIFALVGLAWSFACALVFLPLESNPSLPRHARVLSFLGGAAMVGSLATAFSRLGSLRESYHLVASHSVRVEAELAPQVHDYEQARFLSLAFLGVAVASFVVLFVMRRGRGNVAAFVPLVAAVASLGGAAFCERELVSVATFTPKPRPLTFIGLAVTDSMWDSLPEEDEVAVERFVSERSRLRASDVLGRMEPRTPTDRLSSLGVAISESISSVVLMHLLQQAAFEGVPQLELIGMVEQSSASAPEALRPAISALTRSAQSAPLVPVLKSDACSLCDGRATLVDDVLEVTLADGMIEKWPLNQTFIGSTGRPVKRVSLEYDSTVSPAVLVHAALEALSRGYRLVVLVPDLGELESQE